MESIKPFFSVIIPIYNSSKYIERCIDSILSQEFCDVEIILVDDGSTDDSVKVISKFLKEYPFIKLRHQSNKGVSAARNLGLVSANGKYVLFMDYDDYFINETMSELHKMLVKNINVDILLFNYSEATNHSIVPHEISPRFLGKNISQNTAIESVLSSRGHLGYCWNKVYKKSSIQHCRFDENITYLEDMLFNIICILNSTEIMSIGECLYAYNLRFNSVVNTFGPKHMTLFDSLNTISKAVPDEFQDVITLKKRFANIEFGSKNIFKSKKYYEVLKHNFKKEKRIFRLKKFDLGKQELIALSLGNISFTISVIALWLMKLIKKL